MRKPTVRFAPSPTGRLHIGNIRTALVNWLYARKHHGDFLLRIDDTDQERCRLEYEEGIKEDLTWLGLDYDHCTHQLDRMDRYALAVEKLKEAGRLYPCYETPEELSFKRKRQLSQGRPPLYDRAALKLTDAEKAAYEAEGRRPHWRLKLAPGEITWEDLIHGTLSFESEKLSDPVLIREDGYPLYTLSSVVDDVELELTHIIRGDDHIANTAIQVQLMAALGADPQGFAFAHMPLLTDAGGQGLSKRLGSLSIQSLREDDAIDPLAITSLLAKLGTSEAIHLAPSLDQLIEEFDIGLITRSSLPKFSLEELKKLNLQLIHDMPFEVARRRLEEDAVLKGLLPEIDAPFWELIRGNLTSWGDTETYWQIAFGVRTPIIEDRFYIDEAAACLPVTPWDEETWKIWTETLKAKTGRKGKALYMPLRQALTGLEHGPEMRHLLPKIGYDKALKRLQGTTA